MSLLCKLNIHRWTEDTKLSRLVMLIDYGQPFGCTRCGIRRDGKGNIYPTPERKVQ